MHIRTAAVGSASLGFLAGLVSMPSSPAVEDTGEVGKVSEGLVFSDSSVPSGRARLPLFFLLSRAGRISRSCAGQGRKGHVRIYFRNSSSCCVERGDER